jgi:hypothetical protein
VAPESYIFIEMIIWCIFTNLATYGLATVAVVHWGFTARRVRKVWLLAGIWFEEVSDGKWGGIFFIFLFFTSPFWLGMCVGVLFHLGGLGFRLGYASVEHLIIKDTREEYLGQKKDLEDEFLKHILPRLEVRLQKNLRLGDIWPSVRDYWMIHGMAVSAKHNVSLAENFKDVRQRNVQYYDAFIDSFVKQLDENSPLGAYFTDSKKDSS